MDELALWVAQLMVQLKGIVYVGGFTLTLSLLFWYAIKLTMGLRVSPEEELEGLDIGEHGSPAYPDFATHDPSLIGVAAPVGNPQTSGAHVPVRAEA